jgi:hypothetical protein
MKSRPDISSLLPDDETLRARRNVLTEAVGGASRRRRRQASARRVAIAIVALVTIGGGAAWAVNVFVTEAPRESIVRPSPLHDVGAVRLGLVQGEVTAFHLPKGQMAYAEVSPSRSAAGKLVIPPREHPTYVIAVEPVDANQQPVAGLKIEERGAGICFTASDFAGNVYRCSGGRFIYDPCWKDDADPSTAAVLCQGAPWDDHLYHLTLQQPRLPSFLSPPLVIGGDNAWGLELTTGERCLIVQGAHSYVGNPPGEIPENHVVDYYCQSKNGKPEARVLLRGIDRSNPRWRITTACSTKRGRCQLGPKVGIAKAWYAAQE